MAYNRDIRTITKRTPRGIRRVRVAMGAFTDLSKKDCGTDQLYDPAISYAGNQGQCVTEAQYNSYHANNPTPSGGGFFSDLAAGLASVFKPTGAAPAPVIVQGGGGISTTTALALGGGALLLVVLLTRK